MLFANTQTSFQGVTMIKPCYKQSYLFRIRCCDSKPSNARGFGPSEDNNVKKRTTSKEQKGTILQQSKSTSRQSTSVPGQAPGVSSRLDRKFSQTSSDFQFEERLQAVKRSALEKKKEEEKRDFGVIDYDAPVEPKQSTVGLGTKIGVGVAVVVFGLVFALGDFLPSGSITSSEDDGSVSKKMSKEETAALQSRLQEYEATLTSSPKDPVALEGAAVTLAELGDYNRAATFLEDLTKEKPSDPDVFRLLGEIRYQLKDYDASVAAYKNSAKVSKVADFEVLRGLTNALLAAKKPDEAVQILLASREHLDKEKSSDSTMKTQSSSIESEAPNVDPIQVELLLGKAYSDWGHISDAVSVYDQLISTHPNDFRGYLAKGILLKANGNVGDAERMFIQARFFAPEKVKALVDRYSRS